MRRGGEVTKGDNKVAREHGDEVYICSIFLDF